MIANEAVNMAIDYILNHITENISAEEVAAHCHFSKHYFSRIFKLSTGEGIYAFIKRVKMEQSAFRLKVEKARNITEIAADYGYSASNYSSGFKQHHHISPVRFRDEIVKASMKNPIYKEETVKLEDFAACNKKITIETLADTPVIYERRIGNYGNLSADWGAFQEKYKPYITADTLFMERTYDDPAITDTGECLYDICMTMSADTALPNTDIIKGGKFAVYHFSGAAREIYAAYQSIFNVWLSQSGRQIDDRYGFEIYRKIDCDAMYMEIDICIPIQ